MAVEGLQHCSTSLLLSAHSGLTWSNSGHLGSEGVLFVWLEPVFGQLHPLFDLVDECQSIPLCILSSPLLERQMYICLAQSSSRFWPVVRIVFGVLTCDFRHPPSRWECHQGSKTGLVCPQWQSQYTFATSLVHWSGQMPIVWRHMPLPKGTGHMSYSHHLDGSADGGTRM